MDPFKVNEGASSSQTAEKPVYKDNSDKMRAKDPYAAYIREDTDIKAPENESKTKVKEPEPAKGIDPMGQKIIRGSQKQKNMQIAEQEPLRPLRGVYREVLDDIPLESMSPRRRQLYDAFPQRRFVAYPMVEVTHSNGTMYVAGDYLDMSDPEDPVSILYVEEFDRPYMIPDFAVKLRNPEAARAACFNLNAAIQNLWNTHHEAGRLHATFSRDLFNLIMNYEYEGRRIWPLGYMVHV